MVVVVFVCTETWRSKVPAIDAVSSTATVPVQSASVYSRIVDQASASPWMMGSVEAFEGDAGVVPVGTGASGAVSSGPKLADLAGRSPRLQLRTPGGVSSRFADRQSCALPFQVPPRLTRSEPDTGPTGSSSTPPDSASNLPW